MDEVMVQYMEIHQTNSKKKHMVISLDAEKAFQKIQYLFLIKVLERSWIKVPYVNKVKAIYSKPVASIKLKGKKIDSISLNG